MKSILRIEKETLLPFTRFTHEIAKICRTVAASVPMLGRGEENGETPGEGAEVGNGDVRACGEREEKCSQNTDCAATCPQRGLKAPYSQQQKFPLPSTKKAFTEACGQTHVELVVEVLA